MNGSEMDAEGQELFKEALEIVREFLATAQNRENKVVLNSIILFYNLWL